MLAGNNAAEKQPQERRLGKLKNGNQPCDLWSLPLCQATAKSTGQRCGNIAIKTKKVCYLHGGRSPGANKGNKRALKDGMYTKEKLAERRQLQSELDDMTEFLDKMLLG